MPDRYEDALRVLGLESGATEQAIKDAYRDLVKVWHPDRFGSDARLREKAQDKLREVNAAFEQLRGYSPSKSRPRPEPIRPQHRETEFAASRTPASPIERRNAGGNRYLLLLCTFAALAGFAATGLVMLRDQESSQPAPPRETVQPPAPAKTTRAPVPPSPRRESSTPSTPGHEPAVSVETGSLVVNSRPMGAQVSFDGRVVGVTPLAVTEVTPGEHRLDVTLDGNAYQPWSTSVVVAAGQEEKLLAVLTPAARKR